jgi:23S rRNA (cytosine1962-C5)-methyltransferase
MKNNKTVILKPGKEKPLLNRHHWIFSGAIQTMPSFDEGEILAVQSSKGDFLGWAYFNSRTSIAGRMIAFTPQDPLETLRLNVSNALALRKQFFDPNVTNAYRLINGEGDFIPGLVVDRYADVIVFQISTLGMDKLRSYIVNILQELTQAKVIFEKSVLPNRKEEGLPSIQQYHSIDTCDEVEIKENGLRFLVSYVEGQKTGFFLDQREMRALVKKLSLGRKVLNCFAYTGGFSVYAASGGALSVTSLDISQKAVALARNNLALNGFAGDTYECIEGDVFTWLREEALNYNLVILDPPAFAKKQRDVNQACRGYKDINRIAMQKMPPKSFLLTCSCSYHVDTQLFKQVIFQAAVEAKRQVRILSSHHQAPDHALNLCHPEGDYLKSLLLYID